MYKSFYCIMMLCLFFSWTPPATIYFIRAPLQRPNLPQPSTAVNRILLHPSEVEVIESVLSVCLCVCVCQLVSTLIAEPDPRVCVYRSIGPKGLSGQRTVRYSMQEACQCSGISFISPICFKGDMNSFS